MIKQLQKIGNSRGIVLDKALLDLLDVKDNGKLEIIPTDGGLLIRRPKVAKAYESIAAKHRRSLDKLGQ